MRCEPGPLFSLYYARKKIRSLSQAFNGYAKLDSESNGLPASSWRRSSEALGCIPGYTQVSAQHLFHPAEVLAQDRLIQTKLFPGLRHLFLRNQPLIGMQISIQTISGGQTAERESQQGDPEKDHHRVCQFFQQTQQHFLSSTQSSDLH